MQCIYLKINVLSVCFFDFFLKCLLTFSLFSAKINKECIAAQIHCDQGDEMRASKFENLKEQFVENIRSGIFPPGSQLPSYRELIRNYGVSQSTVNKVFTELVRMELIYVESGRGYYVRHQESNRKKSNLVLVILASFENSYFMMLQKGIITCLQENGYRAVTMTLGEVLGHVHESTEGIIGIIMTSPQDESALLSISHNGKIPLVMIDFERETLKQFSSITNDDYRSGVLAAKQLLAYGHERIMHLSGPFGVSCAAIPRARGFADTMQQAGVEPVIEYAGWDFKGGYYAFKKHYLRHRPTGIFAVTDLTALGAIRAANEMGLKVPDDLSVVGHGDLCEANNSTVNLTTIRVDAVKLGYRGANLLKDLLLGKPPVQIIQTCEELIERETVSVVKDNKCSNKKIS